MCLQRNWIINSFILYSTFSLFFVSCQQQLALKCITSWVIVSWFLRVLRNPSSSHFQSKNLGTFTFFRKINFGKPATGTGAKQFKVDLHHYNRSVFGVSFANQEKIKEKHAWIKWERKSKFQTIFSRWFKNFLNFKSYFKLVCANVSINHLKLVSNIVNQNHWTKRQLVAVL